MGYLRLFYCGEALEAEVFEGIRECVKDDHAGCCISRSAHESMRDVDVGDIHKR